MESSSYENAGEGGEEIVRGGGGLETHGINKQNLLCREQRPIARAI